MNTLILNANDLVAVLSDRRYAIVELLAHTSALSKQLSGLIHENEQELAPTLDKLNAVTAILEKNRDNIAQGAARVGEVPDHSRRDDRQRAVLPGVRPQHHVRPSCCSPSWITRSGSARGVNAGQPPDNAGPRAELPFPYNGIPGPGEQWGPPLMTRKPCS